MGNGTPLYDMDIKVAEPVAEWHLAPEEERLVGSQDQERWVRGLSWLFIAMGVAFYVLTRGASTTAVSSIVTTGESVIMVGIAQCVLIYLLRRKSNALEFATGLRRLGSKVPEIADLLVNVAIYREGVLTGKDSGYIWLDNGTWYFKGLATAFRINQQDVVPVEAWPRRQRPDPANDRAATRFPLKSLSGRVELRIKVADPYADFTRRKKAKEFYRQMHDWLYERPRSGIESLLPPLQVHPCLPHPKRRVHGGVVSGFVLVGVNSLLLLGLLRDGTRPETGPFRLLAGVVVIALLGAAVWLASVEMRDATVRSNLEKKSLSD